MKTTIYISKYALSSGITKHESEIIDDGLAKPGSHFVSWALFKIGKECHLTREGAVLEAESQRVKKIASLKKQIAKLEKLSFLHQTED